MEKRSLELKKNAFFFSVVKYSNATLRIVFFNHDEFEFDKKYHPKALVKVGQYKDQVRYKRPRISGLTNPKVTENVLHSKLFISDK